MQQQQPQKPMTVEQVARVCHEANRAYCVALGDHSQKEWEGAPAWQVDSAIKGVRFHLRNPSASPAASHEEWLQLKRAQGWEWGPVKDEQKRQHPCFLPFADLPSAQQRKDVLFKAIVDALRACVVEV